MNENIKIELGATLLERINSVRMSDIDRQVALDAMWKASVLVNGCLWLAQKIGQLGALGFLKPSAQ